MVSDSLKQRTKNLFRRSLHTKRNRRVVDILGRQSKMDEFAKRLQTQLPHAILDEVLDGLDVVVRRAFKRLNPERI